MKFFAFGLVSLAFSLAAHAVEYPEVKGKLHSVGNLDLAKITITVKASCSDPKTGDCGQATAAATIDAANGTFRIPAMSLDPMGMSGKYEGYFSSGWGKRFDYVLTVTGPDDLAVIHDLVFWSWEARPGNTVAMMLRDIPLELAHLTFYHATAPSKLSLKPAKEFQGQYLKMRIQKQFQPVAAKDTPDVAKMWVVLDLTKVTTAKDEISAVLEPIRMLVRGEPAKYGSVPKTRTVAHVYKKITEKKFRFMGLADETAPFEGKGMFAADVTVIQFDPKAASGDGSGD